MATRYPPGPVNLPLASVWRQRNLLPFLQHVAARYGDVSHFRVGRQHYYLVNDPELVRGVLVTDAANFTKGPALRAAKITLGEGLLTSEGDLHRRQRRLIGPVFHPKQVATYGEQMVSYAQRMADDWRDGRVFDVHEQMTALTLEVVTKVLFGGEISGEVDRVGEAMRVMVVMFDRARNPLAPVLNRLPLPSNFRFLRALREVESTLQGFIDRRRAEGGDRPDLLSLLLKARDTEGDAGGMSDQQLRDEAVTLFAAGHETTANALVWTWYLLAQNPQAERRLHEELDDVLGGGRVPTVEDLDRLAYTRCVLAESMRLYPPAWVIARQAKERYELAGYAVPAGSVLLMSQFLLHRDARYWEDPLRFEPGRFAEGARAASGRPKYAYFPFGGGPRSCVGEPFAWVEATLLLATLARRWRLELAEPGRPVELHPTITLRPRGALRMRVRGRRRKTEVGRQNRE